MPEIKIKHVVSFSSEDKVHKAENLIKPETYRKWKCATPGEKSANVVLQFEKAVQIHSIDIGNENSAFVEVLVGRSSDSVSNFQVLLVASSFMSPLESRNGTHGNRVRMFGPEKLSQNAKDEKWDCVQVVCTQPFNKTITYGLTFVKFHSPPEKNEEMPKITESLKAPSKIGPFKIRYDDDDDDDESVPSVGSWFGKKKTETSENSGSSANKDTLSYATIVLSSKTNTVAISSQSNAPKRKTDENIDGSQEPPTKKPATSALSKEHITYKNVLDDKPQNKNITDGSKNSKIDVKNSKTVESKKASAKNTSLLDKPSSSKKQVKVQKKVPFEKIMEKVVIVLSGFVNPLRSELRDKALDMGAKYKGDWDSSCTHLICAFLNTPKYTQVSKLKGKIVSKDWITDCYKKRQLLPWRKYILKNPSDDSSESESKFTEESEAEFTEESEDETDFSEGLEDSEEEYVVEKKKKNLLGKKAKTKAAIAPRKKNLATPKANDSANKIKDLNTSNRKGVTGIINPRNNDSDNSCSPSLVAPSGSKDGSETEDEEALQDYMADTDVDNESGGDTEDEIRKVERKAQRQNVGTTFQNQNGVNMETELLEKPDIADLPLPELPNFFKQKHFFLYGDFDSSKQHVLQRYITAYNGVLDYYMSDKVKYVITENRWDNKFDDALSKNEDLIFVKPAWIYKCHEARKLMPYQPFIIIPDS